MLVKGWTKKLMKKRYRFMSYAVVQEYILKLSRSVQDYVYTISQFTISSFMHMSNHGTEQSYLGPTVNSRLLPHL